MPDSTAEGQDGAQYVDKARFDGLMSSYQKAQAENAASEPQAAIRPVEAQVDLVHARAD